MDPCSPQSHCTHVVASIDTGQSRFPASLLSHTGSHSAACLLNGFSSSLHHSKDCPCRTRGKTPAEHTAPHRASAQLRLSHMSACPHKHDECRIIWFSKQVFPCNCLEQKCPKLILSCETVGMISRRWVIACANEYAQTQFSSRAETVHNKLRVHF